YGCAAHCAVTGAGWEEKNALIVRPVD
ncbi:MAG: hypothetical protein H6Q28_1427, partial [Bacteroidetes bacterium]|nr:hypothetical protein [Bacteroidota bacterium]